MFGKKPTAEDLLKMYAALSDDEKEAFDKAHKSTEEQIEEAEENVAEKGTDTQTEKDRVDESVAAQEKDEGNEDAQDAKDRVDEAEGAEKADTEEKAEAEAEEAQEDIDDHEAEDDDMRKAYEARFTELNERIAELTDRFDKMVEALDTASEFGRKAELSTEEKDEDTDSPIMRNYRAKANRW